MGHPAANSCIEHATSSRDFLYQKRNNYHTRCIWAAKNTVDSKLRDLSPIPMIQDRLFLSDDRFQVAFGAPDRIESGHP